MIRDDGSEAAGVGVRRGAPLLRAVFGTGAVFGTLARAAVWRKRERVCCCNGSGSRKRRKRMCAVGCGVGEHLKGAC